MVAAISKLNENIKISVITRDGEIKYFRIKATVLQGDTLASLLFVITMFFIKRRSYKRKEAELGL